MRPSLFCLSFSLALSGCTTLNRSEEPQELLAHEIVIPREFRGGRANPHFPSAAERYMDAYDQAWWACVETFARDIEHTVAANERAGNGWPSFVQGFRDGHVAAEARVKKIKGRFGGAKAQSLLRRSLEFPQ